MKNKYTCCVKDCDRKGYRSYSSLKYKNKYEYKENKNYICEGHYRKNLRKYNNEKKHEKEHKNIERFKTFCKIILEYENYKK